MGTGTSLSFPPDPDDKTMLVVIWHVTDSTEQDWTVWMCVRDGYLHREGGSKKAEGSSIYVLLDCLSTFSQVF